MTVKGRGKFYSMENSNFSRPVSKNLKLEVWMSQVSHDLTLSLKIYSTKSRCEL